MSILKSLKTETKSAWVEFPGMKGFEVHVGAISRDLSRRLKKESEITKIDSKHRVPVTQLDEDKFVEKFSGYAVLGWKGLTYTYLEDLMLIDTSMVEDMDALVPFTAEDAIELVKQSQTFDNWLNEQVFSLEIFRRGEKPANSGKAKDLPK